MHLLSFPPTQKGPGNWLLLAFLAVAWISTLSQALPYFVSASLVRTLSLGCLALYPALLMATVWLLEEHKHCFLASGSGTSCSSWSS